MWRANCLPTGRHPPTTGDPQPLLKAILPPGSSCASLLPGDSDTKMWQTERLWSPPRVKELCR